MPSQTISIMNEKGGSAKTSTAVNLSAALAERGQKVFHWDTGDPGGIKGRTMGERLSGGQPEKVVLKAVERMLPKGPLGRQTLRKLRVYAGAGHPHEAQNPEVLDLAAMNAKNKRSA